jgi:uncharacterized glyoxalase superfamily protein PhnB
MPKLYLTLVSGALFVSVLFCLPPSLPSSLHLWRSSSQIRERDKHPDEIGGAETQMLSLVVSDCTELYAKAKTAGARILSELEKKEYGGEAFTCSDPEGHIWYFGTYNPWEP